MLKPGKIAKLKPIVSIRDLTRVDLEVLREKRAGPPLVSRFRDPHHRLARLCALGLRDRQIAEQSGYSIMRLTTLRMDPAFQELVASYRATVDEEFREEVDAYYSMATSNMLKAERQIAEKLDEADENGETLPVNQLIAISRDAADRFGYGKKQTNLNVNVDFAAQLEKAIARSGKQIDVTPSKAGPHVSTRSIEAQVGPTHRDQPPLRRRA